VTLPNPISTEKKHEYVDLQVNGYGGIDFNDDNLSAEGLHTACDWLRRHGVEKILATIITEKLPTMCARLRRLVDLRQGDPFVASVIPGIHIEGPFLSPINGFRGAHPLDAIRPSSEDEVKQLLEAAGGLTRIVTLAPDFDEGAKVTRYLAGRGITVSAGHTDASLDQLKASIDAGLKLFTHVGNGCPMQMPRHDNIIQRVLSLAGRIRLCFIADNVHVPAFALRNYLKCAGIENCIVVTDAIAAAGLGPGRYRLSRWDLQIGEDLAARSPDGSHLVGSAVTMNQSEAVLREKVGLTAADCHRLLVTNPSAFLG
jgi:N-acetylglucosamine-6-phosphate deacetylase